MLALYKRSAGIFRLNRQSSNSHPRCAKRCRSLTLKSQDTQRAGSVGQDCSFMPRRSFAVSKSILDSSGHVLTTRPFSIGIGPKQVRPKVLNATVCTWPLVDWMNQVHRAKSTGLSSMPPHGVDTPSIVLCLWKRSHSLYLPKI